MILDSKHATNFHCAGIIPRYEFSSFDKPKSKRSRLLTNIFVKAEGNEWRNVKICYVNCIAYLRSTDLTNLYSLYEMLLLIP